MPSSTTSTYSSVKPCSNIFTALTSSSTIATVRPSWVEVVLIVTNYSSSPVGTLGTIYMQHTEYSLKLEYFCTTLLIPCRCSHDTSQRSSILIVLIGVSRQVSGVELFRFETSSGRKIRWVLESCADGVFGLGLVEYNDGVLVLCYTSADATSIQVLARSREGEYLFHSLNMPNIIHTQSIYYIVY